jgi:predicted MPP superfamily phosphohydrolase
MKKRLTEALSIFLLGFACWLVADIWTSSHCLKVNEYRYLSHQVEEDIILVVISDLHEQEFGEGNRGLIDAIERQSPDLILMLGDMINEDSKNPQIVYELIENLTDTAPVYFAPGNHEWEYIEHTGSDVIQKLEGAGAVVLEKEYVDVEVKGTTMRIGGFYGYAFYLDYYWDADSQERKAFLTDFTDTENLKIMMSHRPDSFIFGDAAFRWDIDLLLSGHLHGGQVVVPFLGGVSGGDQGWFPDCVHGMYKAGRMYIFVTSGLGTNPDTVPRINNRPEVAVIHIEAE